MNPKHIRNFVLLGLLLVLVTGSRTIAEFIIEYHWWNEVDQVPTWLSMLLYRFAPAVLASAIAWFAALWAHRRGLQFAGVPSGAYKLYTRLVTFGLLVIAIVFIGSGIDSWNVMAFVGSQGAGAPADVWTDPVWGRDLSFYLFDLPFLGLLLRYLFTVTLLVGAVFWVTARGWQMYEKLQRFREGGGSMEEFDPGPNPLLLEGATETSFARIIASVALLAGATWFFLGRYTLLLNRHAFMSGMDFVDEQVTLPLRWVVIIALLAAIPLIWQKKLKFAAALVVASIAANTLIPGLVRTVYVRPNELSIERPYIARHIEATNEAFGLTAGQERVFGGAQEERLDVQAHSTLIDNIRLWDTQALSDTITQIQALRPYYRFADVDIDRYKIDGKIKQVLLSPREIDINQLPIQAQESWINSHFIYTHGYGVVAAEVNRTTDDGLPVLLIKDAPPQILTPDIKIERPEIYFGEITHDPVFVNTDQKEFDYPSGDENITSNYQGDGGFPIDSLGLRLAAALRQAQVSILLTGLTNPNSRMMIHRNVEERLAHIAPFIEWDPDPYMVIDSDGRLMWIVDGYTTSDVHPYSESAEVGFGPRVNYIRNSVKAVVDAYHGTTTLYVFDDRDPILAAYRSLFPQLFTDASKMSASVREHVRYPMHLFDVQAEIYRTFHMNDPEVFYNKEDVWDVASSLSGDRGEAARMRPIYIVATLPEEDEPEFLLMLPFTPRSKDNLIGWMAARCDGENLGDLVYFQLSKQELVYGPNQIESRINQDQEIAKDLTLWNQQGSRVLRGELLALPIGDSFLYVESIYIQAETARMPQLKKVVLAMGNRLIYEDTFEEALLSLDGGRFALPEPEPPPGTEQIASSEQPPQASSIDTRRIRALAARLSQLREQAEGLVEQLAAVEQELSR